MRRASTGYWPRRPSRSASGGTRSKSLREPRRRPRARPRAPGPSCAARSGSRWCACRSARAAGTAATPATARRGERVRAEHRHGEEGRDGERAEEDAEQREAADAVRDVPGRRVPARAALLEVARRAQPVVLDRRPQLLVRRRRAAGGGRLGADPERQVAGEEQAGAPRPRAATGPGTRRRGRRRRSRRRAERGTAASPIGRRKRRVAASAAVGRKGVQCEPPETQAE